jgi:hypothetical protein
LEHFIIVKHIRHARKGQVNIMTASEHIIPSPSAMLFCYAPKQWLAVWSHLRQPPGSTLYGARLETWWAGNARSVAVRGQEAGSDQR